MLNVEFKIFHESKKPPNAERAIRAMRNFTKASFEIKKVEPYLDKGCLAVCETSFESKTWEKLIFEILRFAQQFGIAWTIYQGIEKTLELSTHRFHSSSGVTSATIFVSRKMLS